MNNLQHEQAIVEVERKVKEKKNISLCFDILTQEAGNERQKYDFHFQETS